MATGPSWPTLRARPTRSAASGAWWVKERELRGSTGISGNADYQRLCKETAMRTWVDVMMVTTAVAAMTLGCSQQSGTAVVIEDKVYTGTPASVPVKAGIGHGEVQ